MKIVFLALAGLAAGLGWGGVERALPMLPAGAVKPRGWLLDMARTQARGNLGRMDEVHEAFRVAWSTNMTLRGKDLYWGANKGLGWSFEGGGYWFDGAYRLARQLGDAELERKIVEKVDAVVERMSAKGAGFLWWIDRTEGDVLKQIPPGEEWWVFHPYACMARVVDEIYRATGDEKYARALEMAYDWDWRAIRCGGLPTGPQGAVKAHEATGSAAVAANIAKLVEEAKAGGNRFRVWRAEKLGSENSIGPDYDRKARKAVLGTHGVMFAEGMTSGLYLYLHTGDREFLENVERWVELTEAEALQPCGAPTADEMVRPWGAWTGTETCTAAAWHWLAAEAASVTGEGAWADRAERVFYNAAPAAANRDFTKNAYYQKPNRTAPGKERKSDFHATQRPLCCTAAMARLLPHFVQTMWTGTAEGGLAALHYAPCAVRARVKGGAEVELETEGAYPFEERAAVRFAKAEAGEFEVKFRMPGWCDGAKVRVNGELVRVEAKAGFAGVRREWKSGDRVELEFPMKVRGVEETDTSDPDPKRRYGHCGGTFEWGKDQSFAFETKTVRVDYGPFAMSLGLKAEGEDHNRLADEGVRWKYALKGGELNARVARGAMPAEWKWQFESPLKVEVDAWEAEWDEKATGDRLPTAREMKRGKKVRIALQPYGTARCRVTRFPAVREGRVSDRAAARTARESSGLFFSWGARHVKKLEEIAKGPKMYDAVFVGDSITHNWEIHGMRAWRDLFGWEGASRALNLGFGADRTEHMLWRLENGELDGYEARHVFVMAGTNNSGHRGAEEETAEDTAAGVAAIVETVRRKRPEAKVVLTAIFPRGVGKDDPVRKRNEEANRLIAKLADGKRVVWQDLTERFLDGNGEVDGKLFFRDKLHPNGEGYKVWAEAVKEFTGDNHWRAPMPAWPPRVNPGLNGRKADYYMHGWSEKWGGRRDQASMFTVQHPAETEEGKKYPLVVVLHCAGHNGMNVLDCARGRNYHDLVAVEDGMFALYPDCALGNNRKDYWWGTVPEAKKGFGPEPGEHRVLDTIKWTIKNYPIDENRVYMCGISMGGSGTLGLGVCNGGIFAALKANVPATIEHVSARMGFAPYGAPEGAKIADPPVTVDFSAQNDHWGRGHERFARGMAEGKYPLMLYWGMFGHQAGYPKIAAHNDIIHDFDWLKVRKDEAYPVFTKASSDTKAFPWPCNAKELPPGQTAGQINGYFRWRNVRDEARRFAMELWLAQPHTKIAELKAPREATAEVTLRRLQNFRVGAGEEVRWRCGGEWGTARAGAGGLLTLEGVGIGAEARLLEVESGGEGPAPERAGIPPMKDPDFAPRELTELRGRRFALVKAGPKREWGGGREYWSGLQWPAGYEEGKKYPLKIYLLHGVYGMRGLGETLNTFSAAKLPGHFRKYEGPEGAFVAYVEGWWRGRKDGEGLEMHGSEKYVEAMKEWFAENFAVDAGAITVEW